MKCFEDWGGQEAKKRRGHGADLEVRLGSGECNKWVVGIRSLV